MEMLLENQDKTYIETPSDTKLCPYCAERIQLLAIKCRHCGEFFCTPPVRKPAGKWYYSTTAMVSALLSFGPLALPLVWMNPRLKVVAKIAVTLGTLVATVFFCWAMARAYANLMNQVQSLGM